MCIYFNHSSSVGRDFFAFSQPLDERVCVCVLLECFEQLASGARRDRYTHNGEEQQEESVDLLANSTIICFAYTHTEHGH